MSVSATIRPSVLAPGGTATVAFVVTNGGVQSTPALTLVDRIGSGAQARGAHGGRTACDTSSRRASCPLGMLAPGGRARVTVTLVTDLDPVIDQLVQNVALEGDGESRPVELRFTTRLTTDDESVADQVLNFPSDEIIVVLLLTLALAATRSRPPVWAPHR
ncbi:MAG: hypothetical protein ACRDZN_06930 [Acidimicrobiales bacterium]